MEPVEGVKDDVTHARAAYATGIEVSSSPGSRSRELYDAVINQFGVATNKRYRGLDSRGEPQTWCNIFVRDVTYAMGVSIPIRVNESTWKEDDAKGVETNVKRMKKWLDEPEGSKVWKKITPQEAQKKANEGKPVIVIDDGTHVGVIRPGTIDPEKGPAMAEAGDEPNQYKYNFNDGHVEDSATFVGIGWEELSYYYAD